MGLSTMGRAALAAVLAIGVSAAHAFDVGFSANGPGGSVVIGYLNLLPLNSQVTDDLLANGTKVRSFIGLADGRGGWVIEERDRLTLGGGSVYPYDMRLDSYLYPDGHSRAELTLINTVPLSDTLRDQSLLNLNFTCSCGDLYVAGIGPDTFARREAISGLATQERQSLQWLPNGQLEMHVDAHQEIRFSAPVPEPRATVLAMLGGGVAVLWARRQRRRDGRP